MYNAAARRRPRFGPWVTRVTTCLDNLKVLIKYESTGPQRFDTLVVPGVFSTVEVRMNRSSKIFNNRRWRGVSIAVLASLALVSGHVAEAQSYCQEWTSTLLPLNTNCVSDPRRERAFGGDTFSWNGEEYLIFSSGNELALYKLGNDPANPTYVTVSRFKFGTAGDSDYDIMSFDACDDCRYMVMDHKVAGIVVIDLGAGSEPAFTANSRNGNLSIGSIVFSHGGQEYMVAGRLTTQCGFGSALFAVNGVSNLDLVQCVEADGVSLYTGGGKAIYAAGQTHIYLGADTNGDVTVFRVDGSGLDATLTQTASPAGMKGRRAELALDANHLIGVSADFKTDEVVFWDLADPGNPVLKPSWTLTITSASMVDLASQSASTPLVLWAAAIGWQNSAHTYLVDETGPEPIDNGYWSDLSLPHNEFQSCVPDAGGALAPDGSALYLSRYAVQQTFDLSECLGPTPATAVVQVIPSTAFPGDTVTVSDKTAGSYDRWALWIEKNGTYLQGEQTPSGTNPHSFQFSVPKDVAEGDAFEANISIQSDDLTPLQSTDTQTITINRAPVATFTITPDAAVVGETVTLAATAEGNPSDTDPYTWVISKPSSATSFPTGSSVPVNLDESGDWTFKLTVNYDHAASGAADPDDDSKYESVVTQVLNVSSVAADFTVSPALPLNNQPITFDGSISKGNVSSYAWQVYGPTDRGAEEISIPPVDYTGCPNAVECTIPADTLEWGQYTVTLTVDNGSGDSDDAVKFVEVLNGAIQPSIRWSPTDPEIGETVIFSIDGVLVDVAKATWNMGGTGCDNDSSTQVCTPSLFQDCKAQAFMYASGGDKVVSVSVEINGVTFTDSRPAAERTVPVASTGSCGGTTPICTYTLSASGAVFGPGGGASSFTVFTGSNCSWTASDNATWITITSGSSGTGNRTVSYTVATNTGPKRIGYITAGGKTHTVTQNAPNVPADFTMSKPFPNIGEEVIFKADPILDIDHWDFGEASCDGQSQIKDCFWLPTGACNEVERSFGTSGAKNVTMVLTDGRTKTKFPTVQNQGECCLADGAPLASFDGPAEAYTGALVTFTDASSKSMAATKALGFNQTPLDPEIGEQITFTLTGLVGSVSKATWSFGETGCGGESAVKECVSSLFNNCTGMTFTYASSGNKSVSVTVELEGGGTVSAGPTSIDIANAGSCDGGGGGGCSYSLAPLSNQFDADGGSGEITVTTTAECEWDATTTSLWINITSGSGTGSGSVAYSVGPNSQTISRNGSVRVEGRSHSVRQDPPVVESDRDATAWLWSARRDHGDGTFGDVVATGTDPVFSHAFADPGMYRITLVASNCVGSTEYSKTLTVVDSPIEDFVVGAAVSLAGANETQWESDFRFYNPCDEPLDVRIDYEPEGTNNTDLPLVFREFQLAADETRVFADIVEAIPGLAGEELSGSVRIESLSDSGCKVLSVSRTFNDTPAGSLGLFVPALPVKANNSDFLDLTGLVHDSEFRTNLRLVNYSDTDVWVPLALFDRNGNQIGDSRSALVRGHSTKQLNEIAPWLGVEGDIAPFSVRANVTGVDVQAFGTVVDNMTGDSVLFLSNFNGENRIWLVGVASLSGVNNSQWRTDMWLYNPTGDWVAGEVEFVVGDSPNDVFGFEWPTLGTNRVKQYLDIVGEELGLEETRGYIVLTGADGGPAPQVAARTYNLDLAGGTYGLNLRAFGEDDLLHVGNIGHVVGISNSADQSVGFRTNLGLLNTDRDGWTGVRLTLIDVTGTPVGEPLEMMIAPGVLRQFDVAKKFGVSDVTGVASLKIEVFEGGGVAAYATEIDNRTQDSIYIPAQRRLMGVAQ